MDLFCQEQFIMSGTMRLLSGEQREMGDSIPCMNTEGFAVPREIKLQRWLKAHHVIANPVDINLFLEPSVATLGEGERCVGKSQQ